MASSIQIAAPRRRAKARVPDLHNGDRLKQPEFHRRYEAYPEDVKFELIGGIVYMASPVKRLHGVHHPELSTVLTLYKGATPGVEVVDNATIILGEESEPQPDLCLRILPEWGGLTRTTKEGYIAGPPELIAAIAHSSVAIDLHAKKDDYRAAGVLEYLVICLEERKVRWFDLPANRELELPADRIVRCQVFPGLWIDTTALFAGDTNRLVAVLQQGLASAEHRRLVSRLQRQRATKAQSTRQRLPRSHRKGGK